MVNYHIMLLLTSLFVVSQRGRAIATYIILLGEGQLPPRQCSVFFLLLLRKAFSTFPVNSTTSLLGNGRENILETSTSISLNFLLHCCIPLSRLPRTSIFHFWTVPPGPFSETPQTQSSNFGPLPYALILTLGE